MLFNVKIKIFYLLLTLKYLFNIKIYFILSTDESVGLFCEIFSMINSSKELLKFDKDNKLNSLYGFKVLMMIIILLMHRIMNLLSNPKYNPKFVESVSKKIKTKI